MPTENESQQPAEPQHEDTGGRVIERTEKVIERPAPEKADKPEN